MFFELLAVLFKISGVRDYAFSETLLGKRGSPAENSHPSGFTGCSEHWRVTLDL
jgi:hypothetical protein